MSRILNKKLIFFLLVICFGVFIISPVASAITPEESEYGLIGEGGTLGVDVKDDNKRNTTLAKVLKYQEPSTIIGTIIGAALAFIGVLFFILIVYAGFLYMTARGNEEQVKKALDYIYQAIIGLVIVASAYLVTKYIGQAVIDSFTASS